ncbi:hypothetical protein OUZ56_015748 [Daphnia magna]|uniref:Uncharacterized protein n=1 Tax=Daphnia magna TaxID=35525 RepID=A0ABR0ANM5_9CRUS|nr:hypothetical protein OUZ56_015748 [Daphnia magna]
MRVCTSISASRVSDDSGKTCYGVWATEQKATSATPLTWLTSGCKNKLYCTVDCHLIRSTGIIVRYVSFLPPTQYDDWGESRSCYLDWNLFIFDIG